MPAEGHRCGSVWFTRHPREKRGDLKDKISLVPTNVRGRADSEHAGSSPARATLSDNREPSVNQKANDAAGRCENTGTLSMTYKDMTFCTEETCAKFGTTCHRSLTPKVQADADRWFGEPGAPICIFGERPSCYKEKTKNQHK